MSPVHVPLDHPRFRRAQRDIFVKRVVADCMRHQCRLVPRRPSGGPLEGPQELAGAREYPVKLDACCQYGVDVDLAERDAILAHRDEIGALLTPAAAATPWFTTAAVVDAAFPSGRHVRTTTHGSGCVFLAHDQRGCAIHRAALAGGWSFDGVKPHVCRLFPLTYDDEGIVLSDDYPDYSCSLDPEAPTVYRVARPEIVEIFGVALVEALDVAEASVLAEEARNHARGLRIVSS